MKLPWIIKTLFCKHEYKFAFTTHEDMINTLGGKRKAYICNKCQRIKYK